MLIFTDCHTELIKSAVKEGQRPDLSELPAEIPAQIEGLIVHCWEAEPTDRPKFAGGFPLVMYSVPCCR